MEATANKAAQVAAKGSDSKVNEASNVSRPHLDIDLVSATDKDLLNALSAFNKPGYIAGIVADINNGNTSFNGNEIKAFNLKILMTFEGQKDILGNGRLVTQSYWVQSFDTENPYEIGDVIQLEAKRCIILHTEKFKPELGKIVRMKSIVDVKTVLAANGSLYEGYSAIADRDDNSKLQRTNINGSILFNVMRTVKADIEA